MQPTAWQPHGSWGTAPAPAPKPGVIPLRPLGAGEIIDGAIATLRRHWRAVVGITFAIALVTQAIAVVVEGLFIDDSRIDELDTKSNPSVHDLLRAFRDVYAGLGLTILVTALGVLVASAILTVVVSRAVLGRGVTAGEAWRDARPRLLQLNGLALLLTVGYVAVVAVGALPGGLIAVAGAKTLGASLAVLGMTAGLVVAVRLWILFVLAPPALMLERQSIVGALKRSAKLVRGSWWRVLGVQLLTIVLVYIVSTLIQMPFALIASAVTNHDFSSFVGSSSENPSWTYLVLGGIGGVVAATITLPVSSGVTTLLYMDQRIRRESLDIELARAAEKH
ncbi:hypothetical protein [Actinacidiphila guanduensis]|uniref:hypothetical protein n=1 Tax=Actinacidiphila guanduensis TaxID=310781 RepID=UPI001FE576F2|nr:hypothetical protein [Actinacidiphila guanduensis]